MEIPFTPRPPVPPHNPQQHQQVGGDPSKVPPTQVGVQVNVDTELKKTYIMTSTNVINQMTADILCEGLVWVITAMRQAGDTPGTTQKRLDRMKKRVWEGVVNNMDKKLEVQGKGGKIDPTKT